MMMHKQTGSRFQGLDRSERGRGRKAKKLGGRLLGLVSKRASGHFRLPPNERSPMMDRHNTSTASSAASFLSTSTASKTNTRPPPATPPAATPAPAAGEQALKLVAQLRMHVLSRVPGGDAYLQRRAQAPQQRQHDEVSQPAN